MTQYVTKPKTVEAVKFKNEQIKDLPAWVGSYQDYSPMGGRSGVSRTPVGNLLIPGREKSTEVRSGEWLVWDGKRIMVMKEAEFVENYLPYETPNPVTASVTTAPDLPEGVTVAPVEDRGFANPPVEGSQPAVTESRETVQPEG